MIEEHFDVAFVSQMALREKQVQQSYRPIIAVHKWFARRPGTLFRGLLLAEFGSKPVSEAFCDSNQFAGIRIADPFIGGGTPLIEANRLGCDVVGFDINPMAYWVVRQELEHLHLGHYRAEAQRVTAALRRELGHLYMTRCLLCGGAAQVKYFLWVKQQTCPRCTTVFDLWPSLLLAKNTRHTSYMVVCRECGHLNSRTDCQNLGNCEQCCRPLSLNGNASRGRAVCPVCRHVSAYPGDAVPEHRLFALEYHCNSCRSTHKGRFFKAPDHHDIENVKEAEHRARKMRFRFVPDDVIPAGDETNRLIRWGYRKYRDMFNARQLVGLELSCRQILRVREERVRNALATNLSDLLRYQNMLCRYDTMALKSLDVFSVHGFPVSLIQCESNLLGMQGPKGTSIGSGGWDNVISKYSKAKEYCDNPFETVRDGKRKRVVFTPGEWIGDSRNGVVERDIDIRCADSAIESIGKNSLDAAITDPPYFGNVQYAELMDFCYVWLRQLVSDDTGAFRQLLTRRLNELTGNVTEGRGLAHFTAGLSDVFRSTAKALKPKAPLVFTFHHNSLDAYAPVGVAILDSALTCTASLPCPAEMSGSIHINGTKSSIVDTVFVCRKQVSPRMFADPESHLVEALNQDIRHLKEAGHLATDGDVKCLLNGHLIRLCIHAMQPGWNPKLQAEEKLGLVMQRMMTIASAEAVREAITRNPGI